MLEYNKKDKEDINMKKKLINFMIVLGVMMLGTTSALANVSSESQQGTMQATVRSYPSSGVLPITATYQGNVPILNFNTGTEETVPLRLVKNQDQYSLTIPMSDVTYQLLGKEIQGSGQFIYIQFYSLNGTPGDLMCALEYNSSGKVNISGMKIETIVAGVFYNTYIADNAGWLN